MFKVRDKEALQRLFQFHGSYCVVAKNVATEIFNSEGKNNYFRGIDARPKICRHCHTAVLRWNSTNLCFPTNFKCPFLVKNEMPSQRLYNVASCWLYNTEIDWNCKSGKDKSATIASSSICETRDISNLPSPIPQKRVFRGMLSLKLPICKLFPK